MKHLARHRRPRYRDSEIFHHHVTKLSFNIIWLCCSLLGLFAVVGIMEQAFKPPVQQQNVVPDPTGTGGDLDWDTYPEPILPGEPTPSPRPLPSPSNRVGRGHTVPLPEKSVIVVPLPPPPSLPVPQLPVPAPSKVAAPSPTPTKTCKPRGKPTPKPTKKVKELDGKSKAIPDTTRWT